MDFVSAMRFQDEIYEWWMSLSEEEQEQELRELRGDYDTVSDSIIINTEWSDPAMDRMLNFRSADALDGSIHSVKNQIYIQK